MTTQIQGDDPESLPKPRGTKIPVGPGPRAAVDEEEERPRTTVIREPGGIHALWRPLC
jgi:hypothetical protein